MPKNKVSDLITDQEMTFARLVLSGTMTDRDAAQAAGLNPDTAAYTKAKPRVRAYMLEYRAAVQQQLVEQETEELLRKNQLRQKVLDRLWEIAALPAEVTRGSIAGQVKAISMIVAIEGLIPDRRAGSTQRQSGPPLPQVEIDPAACPSRPSRPAVEPAVEPAVGVREQATTVDPQASPAPPLQEDEPGSPEPEPNPAPSPLADAPPDLAPSHSTFANVCTPSQDPKPYVPISTSAPDTRLPFSIQKNRFGRRR